TAQSPTDWSLLRQYKDSVRALALRCNLPDGGSFHSAFAVYRKGRLSLAMGEIQSALQSLHHTRPLLFFGRLGSPDCALRQQRFPVRSCRWGLRMLAMRWRERRLGG